MGIFRIKIQRVEIFVINIKTYKNVNEWDKFNEELINIWNQLSVMNEYLQIYCEHTNYIMQYENDSGCKDIMAKVH